MIKFFKKILPIIVVFTNCCIPKRFSGYNVGFINFIRPEYKNDIGLVKHEMLHSVQFWRNPATYCLGRWLKYFKFLPKKILIWSKKKTFDFECEAYGYQLFIYKKFNLINQRDLYKLMDIFAKFVHEKYHIGDMYSKQDAYLTIRSYFLRFDKQDKIII